MAEVCLSKGEQLELERWCSWNLSSEMANTHLGRLIVRPWRWSSSNTWREMVYMSFEIRTEEQFIIDIYKTKQKVTKDLIHHPLERRSQCSCVQKDGGGTLT